jgi:hypothetical protein
MPEIRIDQDKALRLIAQRLRDGAKMSSVDANAMATTIVSALTSSMPLPKKPGLMNWRMIPQLPPRIALAEIAATMKKYDVAPEFDAEHLWHAVWEHGRELPADVVMTDK